MKRHPPYSAEFKQEAVRLVKEEHLSQAKVARDLNISESALSEWMKQAAQPASASLDATEKAELARLRREVKTLQMERDILKKATAFFARECR
jgi:transposase